MVFFFIAQRPHQEREGKEVPLHAKGFIYYFFFILTIMKIYKIRPSLRVKVRALLFILLGSVRFF